MTGMEFFLAHLMKLGFLAIVVGLFARRRAHVCWSFVS
jgi:hypothetical protein